VHAFRWLNHHLKNDDSLIEKTAVKFFEPEQLKVFTELPAAEKNSEIHETFVAAAPPPALPADLSEWNTMRDDWLSGLREKSFAGWPSDEPLHDVQPVLEVERDGVRFTAKDFTSQGAIRLRLHSLQPANLKSPQRVTVRVLDDAAWLEVLAALRSTFEKELAEESLPQADAAAWQQMRASLQGRRLVFFAPRGIGPTAWDQSQRKQTQHRRRFYLLGQTLDGMRVWDVRQALKVLMTEYQDNSRPAVILESRGVMAGVALYASLFENGIAELHLQDLPISHRDGPYLLNVRRILNTPQTVAMAAERSRIVLRQTTVAYPWDYPTRVARQLTWPDDRLKIVNEIQP
jgi:hypothetical protein